VVSAENDAQVPISDGDNIFAALVGDARTKTRATIAAANHVYKQETRAPKAMTPQEIGASYADEGHALAGGVVEAIASFVNAR
jgi:hypothetical protein